MAETCLFKVLSIEIMGLSSRNPDRGSSCLIKMHFLEMSSKDSKTPKPKTLQARQLKCL